jgi:sugar/nucleoside kinase (ribokinase family)
MAEQAISTRKEAPVGDGGGRSELQDELARSREEVLRLRDLLIGRDAELGVLRGRVTELEAGVARLLNLGARVRSIVPSVVWTTLARLRRRGRQG